MMGFSQQKPAQANPSQPFPPTKAFASAEPQQLADLRMAENQQISDLSIARATSPTVALPQLTPAVPTPSTASSSVISEDALIRQVAGGASLPPSPTGPGFVAPRMDAKSAQPTLITATPNSDVGLKLGNNSQPQKFHFNPVTSTVSSINPAPIAPTTASTPLPPSGSVGDKANLLSQSSTSSADSLIPPNRPIFRSTAVTPPNLTFQGVYLYQGDETSARARITGVYPLSSNVLVGATLDVVTGNAFSDTPNEGFNVNELYIAVSPKEVPNLRFVVGQIDLTSYFDRNSFAKDGATHFFNSVFQTNPALSATGISSRPGALVNLNLNDNIEAKAAVFSSAKGLSEFSLDGFAGEVGIRYGNFIVRGTYATARDAGSNSGFGEIFSFNRGNGRFGLNRTDREEAYGVNAELFIPQAKLGLFGRYGRYNNIDLGEGGDTFSAGLTFLDLFAKDDRLGIAYGQGLSNNTLRDRRGDNRPDVVELFYDFKLLPSVRLGFSVQGRDGFSETIAGVRLKTEFDMTPRGRSN
jgi:hypothetical protein